MNPRALLAVVGVAVALVLLGLAGASSNDWAAKVDGHEIDEAAFLDELAELRGNVPLSEVQPVAQGAEGSLPADQAANWLSGLIADRLLKGVAEERGIAVTADHRLLAERELPTLFGGDRVWSAFPEWFRARAVSRQARIFAVLEDFEGLVREADVRAEYEAAREELLRACASHILVATPEEADALKAELDAGADFATLARERSTDPASGAQGGDLGCAGRGSYVEPFDSTVFTLPLNSVSDPVQTQFGFHLIKVASRDVVPLEEVRQEMTQRAQGRAQSRAFPELLRLLARADVEVSPKYCSSFDASNVACVPLTPPQPPDGLPVDGGAAEEPPPIFQLPPG